MTDTDKSRDDPPMVSLSRKLRSKLEALTLFSMSKVVRFSFALILTTAFFFVEVVLSLASNSTSLMADSFYMLSDILSLSVGLSVALISRRPTTKSTFGYLRAEVVGTLVNTVLVLTLCFTIFLQSSFRLVVPVTMKHNRLVFIIGWTGLIINLLNIFAMKGWPAIVLKFIGADRKPAAGEESLSMEQHGSVTPVVPKRPELLTVHPGTGTRSQASSISSKSVVSDGSGAITPSLRSHRSSFNSATGAAYGGSNNNSCRSAIIPGGATGIFVRESASQAADTVNAVRQRGKQRTSGEKDGVRANALSRNCRTESMNMFGTVLTVVTDSLGSGVVVICSSLNIYVRDKTKTRSWVDYVDPGLSILMTILICPSALKLLFKSIAILMELLPIKVDVNSIISDMMNEVREIEQIHNLHIWKFIDSRIIASVHLVVNRDNTGGRSSAATLGAVKRLLHRHGVDMSTVQLEFKEDNGVCFDEECLLLQRSASEVSCTVLEVLNNFATSRSTWRKPESEPKQTVEPTIIVQDFS